MKKGKSLFLIFLIPLFSFFTGKASENKDIPVADTIKIDIDSFSYSYTKEEFQLILDSFPQLQSKGKIIEQPDSVYYKYPPYVKGLSFDSEAGEDEFFLLYTYFLRQKTGNKHKEVRNNLIKIYRNINRIFGILHYGGTGFGHMYIRIVGYAEYDVYCYPQESKKYGNDNFLHKKKAYIDSLKRIIDEQVAQDRTIHGEENTKERKEMLYTEIQELDRRITGRYYLDKVIDFENHHNYKVDL